MPKACTGAGDGTRTRDTKLGKLVLYQLSYARPMSRIIAIGTSDVNRNRHGGRGRRRQPRAVARLPRSAIIIDELIKSLIYRRGRGEGGENPFKR